MGLVSEQMEKHTHTRGLVARAEWEAGESPEMG